ncbi:MAG TPA: response regulator [Vicinamibacterales bacterium]|nr:response regulator [Vicinamibacterales bacterium]
MTLCALESRQPAIGTGPVVLVVEDHADTRAMYVEFLSTQFRIEQAATATEALAIATTSPPDLIITDLSLPGMDGFELIHRFREQPALRGVAVICLSGYGGYAHEQRARECGADRILLKPCLPDDLIRHVRQVMRERGVAGPQR